MNRKPAYVQVLKYPVALDRRTDTVEYLVVVNDQIVMETGDKKSAATKAAELRKENRRGK